MSQEKRPAVYTTSISGIPDEVWDAFRKQVDDWRAEIDKSYTLRKALEEAIDLFGGKIRAYPQNITWRSTTRAKPVPIQINNESRDALHIIVSETGYKINVVMLNAMDLYISSFEDRKNTHRRKRYF